MATTSKFTLYSFVGSQWAGVPHLGLAEKGYRREEYDIEEVDLGAAENFDPDYLDINPNGTVPSLTSPGLTKPLIQSTEILRWLDTGRGRSLVPEDEESEARMQRIMDLVHSEAVGTDLILFYARSPEELELKRSRGWQDFLQARQSRLEYELGHRPGHAFYQTKSKDNGHILGFYTRDIGPDHQEFFKQTHYMYKEFAVGMDQLENLLVLPYAVGDQVTEADLHVAPWLAHAMHGAGAEAADVLNFEPLQTAIQQSVPGFEIGPKTRAWWANFTKRESFQRVYPTLH
ncbi:hypothetical protein GQ53DRAFT_793771 [Thozetella sp. PMI_491]|nr:hypothetical protein GQ53DRAFT_793771 [Thozetella sp. PMI_491]